MELSKEDQDAIAAAVEENYTSNANAAVDYFEELFGPVPSMGAHWGPQWPLTGEHMRAIILIRDDGARTLGPIVPASFDVEAWAASRRESFALLHIVAVEVHTLH